VAWEKVVELLVVNRLIAPRSELSIHEKWFAQTAMSALLDTVCRATLFRGNGVVPVAHYFVGIGRGTTVQSVRRIAAG
jgi:hypothetical protein